MSLLRSTFALLLILVNLPCVADTVNIARQYVQPCVPAWNFFSGSDGVSSTIQSSVRGTDGLIYLGGREGLYRIEGGNVFTWLPDFTDPGSLPSGRVKALVNEGHYIWIGSNSGLARLNTETGLIERNDRLNTESEFAAVNALAVHGGHLFVATEKGGYAVRLADNINDITIEKRFNETQGLTDLVIHQHGVLATGTSGLWTLSVDHDAQKNTLDAEDLLAIETIGTTVWVISDSQLYKRSESGQWREFTRENLPGLPESGFTALTTDRLGRLWIGARRGMSRWDFSEPHPNTCRRSVLASDRDQDISISHLSGSLGDYVLLGSSGRGAAYSTIRQAVRRIVPGGHYDSGLPPNAIWSHHINGEGQMLAGTSSGLFIERGGEPGYFDPLAEQQLGDKRIYSLAELQTDNYLIGTSKGLFELIDGEAIALHLFKNGDNEPLSPSVFSVKHHENRIFVATSMGMVVLDAKTKSPESVFKTKSDIFPFIDVPQVVLPISRVWSMDFFQDRVFIAGNQGAFEINLREPAIVSSSNALSAVQRQPIGYIYNITVVEDDLLFLGTEAGLVKTDFAFSQYEKVGEINGRKLTAVMSSGRDSRGHIWIGVAYNGLFEYFPESQQWRHLSQRNGLITNGVSQLGLSFTNNDKLTVSNGTGASIVDLNTLDETYPQPLNIKVVDGERNHVFEEGESYQIGPDNRELSLRFLATELVEQGLHSINYSLLAESGFFRQATVPLSEALSFINLAPDTYTFEARVMSTSGDVSQPTQFQFVVAPYWWETILFEVVIIGLCLSLVIAYFYYRTRSIEQRLDIISEERKRVAQELHDTSLQDIFGAKMLARTLAMDLSEKDKNNANRFLSLLDTAITSLRTSVDSLSNLTNVPELTQAVRELEHSVHLPLGTDFSVQESGMPWRVKHQNRFFLYRIIREAVNNAAKHAEADKITVALIWTGLSLNICIKDDGKGFTYNKAVGSNTYGLNSMICMARNARIKLEIDSAPERGTELRMSLSRLFA